MIKINVPGFTFRTYDRGLGFAQVKTEITNISGVVQEIRFSCPLWEFLTTGGDLDFFSAVYPAHSNDDLLNGIMGSAWGVTLTTELILGQRTGLTPLPQDVYLLFYTPKENQVQPNSATLSRDLGQELLDLAAQGI